MSTVSQVRTAIAATVRAVVPDMVCYHAVPDVMQVPALVVRPGKCDYVVGMGHCQDWTYELYVLVTRTEATANQDQLDQYISALGSNSVVAALRATPGLGLADVDATVLSMSSYGGSWESARVPHIGAQLTLRVLVTE